MADKLAYLHQRKIAGCTRCKLHESREHIVPGEGNPHADVMFVGEAPGARENELARPFVGRSGQLLDTWVEHLGLARVDTFITNVVKCRPPQNRDPWDWEVAACVPFLRVQIALIQPKVLVSLGRFAGAFLCGEPGASMKALRASQDWQWQDEKTGLSVPVVPVFHPSYVLRSGGSGSAAEREVVADLRRVRALLET